MVGTDAAMANDTVQHPNPTVHGISVHRELELLVTEIGLSPVQAWRPRRQILRKRFD